MSQTDTQRDGRFLRTVEWLGNMLPHPVTLFIIFIVLLLIASAAGAYFRALLVRKDVPMTV